jgi:hypothetical protein
MAAEGSLPDMPVNPVPMRAVVSAVSTLNPDAEAKTQQLARQSGMGVDLTRSNPQDAQQRATAADLELRDLERRNPILARQLQDPNFAGVAHDDLDSLSRIEGGAAALRREVLSLGGNLNAGLFGGAKSLIDAAGVAVEGTLRSPKPLMDALTGLDPDMEGLKDIWVNPRPWAVQRVTNPAMNWATSGVQPGVPEYVTDPATGGAVKNPDYHWYGRPLVNSIEQVPALLASFMATGKLGGMAAEAAGVDGAATAEGTRLAGAVSQSAAVERQIVPTILSTQSAQNTYAQARAKGADQTTAVMAALSSGLTNYAFMGAMPGAVPASTIKGAVGQWAGRSAAFGTGMAVSDNAIARSFYDPDRSLLEGVPQSVATMAAFEGAGLPGQIGEASAHQQALADIVAAVKESKLRERSPEAFQQLMDAQFEGHESLRIPAQDFVNYFQDRKLDPAAMAHQLGVTNLAEAAEAGSDLEIPAANYTGRLDPEHQEGLLPDVKNPGMDVTPRQMEAGQAELQDWAAKGGVEKLMTEFAQADAETRATPEWQQLHSKLKDQIAQAGVDEDKAEAAATLNANVIAGFARKNGQTLAEAQALYAPEIVQGEAPVDYGEVLARHIEADPEGAIAEYSRLENTDGGRILNTDEARELSWHYRQDRTRSSDVHEAASQFIKQLYARKLNEPVEEGRDPLVLFTAGGTGAGKSSALKTPEGAALYSRADIIYDTNMNSLGSAEKKIQQALDSGRKVAIQYTYREPVEALTGGTLPRAMRMGRTVPLDTHLDTHIGSRQTVEELQAKYADDPRVSFTAIDNSLGKGNEKVAKTLDSLPVIEENGLRERLQNALDAEYKAGRISEAVRNGTADSRRNVQGDAHAGSSRGSRGIQSEPPAADGRKPGAGGAGNGRQHESQGADGTPLGRDGAVSADGVPVEPRAATSEGDIKRYKTEDLALDPQRFQYKLNTDSAGVTNLLKGRKWNEDLADPVSVWHDPEDGKVYVVNGHHRHGLAKENGVPEVWGKSKNAPNAEAARAFGALQNIAAGRGTAMDAAKFFRDSGYTPEELDQRGISMGEATAAKGVALSKLDPFIFDQVVSGKIREGRGVAIGNASSDPADQEALLKLIQRAESKGKKVSDDTVNELARMVKGAGQHTETQDSLFGAQEMTHNLALEKADISSFIREKISQERRTFQSVADQGKAETLGKVEGQNLKPEENARIAQQAAQAQEIYDRLSTRGGTIDDILERAAKELASGGKANAIKAAAYMDVRKAVSETLSSGEGSRADGVSEVAQSPETIGGDSGRTLFQSGTGGESGAAGEHTGDDAVGGKRGWFRMLPDGRFQIGKTYIGDISTFIHEPAHAYLEMFRELTQREGASEPLKDDFKKICDWLGITPEDAYKNGFTIEQHEQWAKANEQYVSDGIAPTSGLARAFQNFAVWFRKIYKRAPYHGVEISPEVRGVMDRMYAGDDAVSRAEMEGGKRLFNSPEEAGWTDAEYKKYAESKGLEVADAKAEVWREMKAAELREKTQDWADEKATVREAVTKEIDARPEYTAIRSLRHGALDDGTELALNRDELVRQFGEERVKALQKLHMGLYRAEGGTDAETAAEMLGYGSGEEMMRSLEGTTRRPAAIEAATRETMTAQHGDIRYDGTLDDKARLAMENDERARNLHSELTALRRQLADAREKLAGFKTPIEIAPLEQYHEAARQMVAGKSIADLQPARYLNASRMFSREAFEARGRGDIQRATEAKNKELLNHFLFREASKEQEFVGKFESYAKRMQSKGIQQRLGLADVSAGEGSDYRDQFNWLLVRYKLNSWPPQAPGRSLRAWAEDVYGQGKEVAIAPGILNESKLADYRNAPLSEVHDLHDALVNVRHLAMQEFKMYVQGKQVDFAEAKNAMIASARENLRVKPEKIFEENRSVGERVRDVAGRADAMLMRMERLVEWLDGGKAGPWHDNLWNLASDSQGDEYTMQHEVTRTVTDALASMPAEMRERLWTEKVNVEGISEPLSRRRMLSIAFNMGNEGNLDRLQKTFDAFGWDRDAIRRIGGMLTHEEWQFVQKAWDSLKPLGERMQEMEKRLTGLPPSMVKVTPFKVALDDGTEMDLAGGYYPIKMDPRFSDKGIQQEAKETAQNAMQSGYVRATTSKGYTKERTGFGGPLDLDYERVLTGHVAKVSKDLSHREFMLSSQRLLLDTEVRKTLRETLGPAYENQFMPWLRTIINDRNGSVQQGLGDLSHAMQTLRSNLVAASIGFKVSTSLLQITHAPRMMLYARPGSIAQSLVDFLAHPIEMTRETRELSPNEMRFRGDNLDRDVRAVLRNPAYKEGYARKAAEAARWTLMTIDHLFSHTLWRAAYRDGLVKYADLSEAEAQQKAVYEADSAVRQGLGTQAPKDLPAIMRQNDFTKLITVLYGFHNGVYNQLRDNAHQFQYGEGSMGSRVGKLTYATILTAIVPSLLGSMVTGDGPKDGENPGLWAAKKALLFSADTVPLLGSLAHVIVEGRDMKFTPLVNAMEKGGKAMFHAASPKEEKDWLGIGLDAGESAGALAGVPGSGQAVKTLRYMKRAYEGRIENPSVWGAIAGGH